MTNSDSLEYAETKYEKNEVLKSAIWIFILFIFVTSEVFVDRVLSNTFSSGGRPTQAGTIVQGLVLCICYILLSVLISNELI